MAECSAAVPLPKVPQVLAGVNVPPCRERMYPESRLCEDLHGTAEYRIRTPFDSVKDIREERIDPEPDEVIASVGRRPDHRVMAVEGAKCLAERIPRQVRDIAP